MDLIIGFTSIGMITGITYPISFLILAGHTLYKKNNNTKINE
jgi:hypothetical protein